MFQKLVRLSLALFVLCSILSFTATAQDSYGKKSEMKGFKAEFMTQFNGVADKILQLADAMSQENYTWRPMEGVRCVSEVFMHIAGANVFMPSFIGGDMPEGMDMQAAMKMEKETTNKDDVKKHLMSSFDNVRKLIKNMKDADLDKEVTIEMMQITTTYRGLLLILSGHNNEHLGQSIAYARMNKVVPPWSQPSDDID
ncbi:DinB family protein [candidate division KSB1 bacterium]|nr:DinB family protein [candidate division KSB1 bacterium]